jgi:hypothetical protein
MEKLGTDGELNLNVLATSLKQVESKYSTIQKIMGIKERLQRSSVAHRKSQSIIGSITQDDIERKPSEKGERLTSFLESKGQTSYLNFKQTDGTAESTASFKDKKFSINLDSNGKLKSMRL